MTDQKICAKSVLIPNIENIQIQTSGKYDRILNAAELMNNPGVYNALGKALQEQYTGIMDKVTAHFSVEEFKELKEQSKELKKKDINILYNNWRPASLYYENSIISKQLLRGIKFYFKKFNLKINKGAGTGRMTVFSANVEIK